MGDERGAEDGGVDDAVRGVEVEEIGVDGEGEEQGAVGVVGGDLEADVVAGVEGEAAAGLVDVLLDVDVVVGGDADVVDVGGDGG